MLNKTIGCESRTVPPLYAQSLFLLAKASHWESREGRKSRRSFCFLCASQKTYAMVFIPPLRSMEGVIVA